MNDAEYKSYHESFLQNNHGTSAAHTFMCILFTVLSSIICSNSAFLSKTSFIKEYIVIVLPLILGHTVFSNYVYQHNLVCVLVLSFLVLKTKQLSSFKVKLNEQNVYNTKKLASISVLRGLTYLITAFCILAVDFSIFPRGLAKTERYGYSLMDTGVGLFIVMSGLVHKDYKKVKLHFIVKDNLKLICILTVLGVSRYVAVKLLNYQEHVTEYGVHWNFFFTLAVTKFISTLILMLIRSNLIFITGTSILILHEALLKTGLEKWVFSNAARDTFLTANREGISSCLGYISLYLLSVGVRNVIKNVTLKRYEILAKLISYSILCWIISFLINYYSPLSRTLTNSAYCTYLLSTLLSMLSILYLFEATSDFVEPKILTIINENGLLYFLSCNLMTGIVNLSFRTLFVSDMFALFILNCYMIVSFGIVVTCSSIFKKSSIAKKTD